MQAQLGPGHVFQSSGCSCTYQYTQKYITKCIPATEVDAEIRPNPQAILPIPGEMAVTVSFSFVPIFLKNELFALFLASCFVFLVCGRRNTGQSIRNRGGVGIECVELQ